MTADLKPYPAMKDSGVEWLGEVPEHWEVNALRRMLRPFDGIKIGPFGSQLKLEEMVMSGNKVYGQANVIRNDFTYGEKFIDDKKFEDLLACEIRPGDLVLTMMGTSGRCARVPEYSERGIMDSHLLRIRLAGNADAVFVAHLIDEAPYVKEQIQIAGKGSIMHGLNSAIVKALVLALPPLPEQAAIVRYLDYVDRRVRRLVRAKRKLIVLLTEQKQAIIHRAVTRGLDPDVPMKDSGVEWLGEVPEHWEVARLRNVTKSVTSGSRGWSSYAADEGPLFIRVANLSRMSLDLRFHDVVRLNLPETSEVVRTRVQPGDLLLSITAYIGSVAVVPPEFEESYVSQHVARCALRETAHNPRWIGYVLLSEVGQTHGKLSLYGGTKDGLSLDDVKDYPLLLPRRDEQDHLVAEIDRCSCDIDTAIERAQHEIELLNEYRTRLIADVVTGKLDVREVAAGLPEVDPLAEVDEPDDDGGIEEFNSTLEEAEE